MTIKRHCFAVCRGAFTLVELLVVIAIIALLTAIVIPVVGTAREKGRRAQCAGNMRNIAVAVYQYAQDNKGRMPEEGFMWDRQYRHLIFLRPYLSDYSIFHCPSATEENSGMQFAQQQTIIDGATRYTDYKLNDHTNYVDKPFYSFRDTSWVVVALDNDWGPARHGGGENFAFLAGHVTWFSREDSAGEDPYGNAPWFNWGLR